MASGNGNQVALLLFIGSANLDSLAKPKITSSSAVLPCHTRARRNTQDQFTFLIEQVISGLPKLEMLRSLSKFGLSQVVVTFQDGTDKLINERLSTVEMPGGIDRPKMGPVATGLGEVFHYVVTGQGNDITDMRTIHDWVIKPKLRTVKGTAEVNSWGERFAPAERHSIELACGI